MHSNKLLKRIRWEAPEGGDDADVQGAETMARTFAYLFGSGGALVLLTLVFPHGDDFFAPGVVAVALLAIAVAVVMIVRFDRLPLRLFEALPPLGTALASVVVYSGGEATLAAYAMFYFWVMLAAFSFFSLRAAVLNLAFVGVAYAVVLFARGGPKGAGVGWVMAMGALAVAGLVMVALRSQLLTVITQLRHRSRQHHAVAEIGRQALAGTPLSALGRWVAEEVMSTLQVDRVLLFRVLDEGELLLQASAGYPRSDWNGAALAADDALVESAIKGGAPIVERNLEHGRGHLAECPLDGDRGCGVAVTIHGRSGPAGAIAVYRGSGQPLSPGDTSFLQAVANVLADATERRRAEDDARHQALHDPLTGRPNRALFLDRLNEALIRARKTGARLAVYMLDVDDFKLVNDGFGHPSGDELLKALAPRLQEGLFMTDTVARLGGDEFAIICEQVGSERRAVEIAESMAAGLRAPFAVDGHSFDVSASIGISLSARDSSADQMIADADAAMYRAKDRSRGSYEIFDDSLRQRMRTRLQFERALRGSVENEELELVYQPIVSLAEGTTKAAEALLRWTHSSLGPVSPGEFIPVAEDSGAIVSLGEWVLREACRQASRWRASYGAAAPLPLHINVSARQLAQSDFPELVEAVLRDEGASPGDIALELTEHALLRSGEAAAEALERLRSAGVAIVLDDFGTGYSSLSHLKQFPIDVVKVDQLFVSNLATEPRDAAIVDAVIGIAHAFDLKVVAEGIETPHQVSHLLDLGCDLGQGFHYARPGRLEEFLERALEGMDGAAKPRRSRSPRR